MVLHEEDGNAGIAAPETFRILVVDDQRLVREMIGDAMEALFPRARVDTARDMGAALEFLSRQRDTDVILFDYRMPDMRGPQSIRNILLAAPKIRIVILSSFIAEGDLETLRKAGAAAAVTKDLSIDQVGDVVRGVLIGAARFEAPGDDERFQSFAQRFSLTDRQAEAMRGLVHGLRNTQISKGMRVSETTVKGHLHAAFRKLKVNNRIAAYELWRNQLS
jgi:DNA-binding NarL/FixJ family response regulator